MITWSLPILQNRKQNISPVTDKTTLTFSNEDRKTTIPVNGTVLKAAILGNISKLG